MNFNKISLLVVLAIASFSAQAQIKVGVRGGFNNGSVKLKDLNSSDYKLEYKKSSQKLGYHFGAVMQVKVLKLIVQPEILLTTVKNDVRVTDLHIMDSTGFVTGTQNFNKLDIPVMVGIKLGAFKIQAGPVATMMLWTKSDWLGETPVWFTDNQPKLNLKNLTMGYQAGIGLQINNLLLDLKYEGNLSKLGDGVEIGGKTINFDQRINQLILSLGLFF